jgi:hypothetical protein
MRAESETPPSSIEPSIRIIDNPEPLMNRYDPRTPRALFAGAAIALTFATLAIAISVPARIERAPAAADLLTQVASERCVPDSDTVITGIDVVAVRTPRAASIAQTRDARLIPVRG